MIVLESFAPRLAEFVSIGITRALAAHPDQKFTSAAVCCCEYMGTFFLALNEGDTDEVLVCRNAADFAVYFDELDFGEWEREFRQENPEVQWKGKTSKGDGAVFFDFLVATLNTLFKDHPLPECIRWFGAELHDGTEAEYWEVNRKRKRAGKKHAGWPSPLEVGCGRTLFAPDGKLLLLPGSECQVWDPVMRRKEWSGKVLKNSCRAVFSPDGSKIALSQEWGATRVYAYPGFAEICGWDMPEDNQGSSPAVFSPCSRYVIQGRYSGTSEITVAVFDATTGEEVNREHPSGDVLQELMAARGGELILWGPYMREERTPHWYLRTWPFVSGEPGRRLPVTFPDKIKNISQSGRLAAISRFYREQPKELQHGLELVTFPEMEPVFVLERSDHRRDGFFDPEERILALAMTGRFEFWDIASGRLLKVVPTKYGNGVYFSPDGRYIALQSDPVKVLRREDITT